MHKRFFVTSTGTGVGKSFITQCLVRQARHRGQSVMAYKPLISGFSISSGDQSDTHLLLAALKLPITSANIDLVSPWRFAPPLAPSMAARIEGRPIDFKAVVAHSQQTLGGSPDVILIEGIGGVMVPIDDRHTVLDWIGEIRAPVLLVVGNYLGTISHTLTAYSVLQQKGQQPAAVILNETEQGPVPMESTMNELKHWLKCPIISVPHQIPGSDLRLLSDLNNLLE